MNLFYTQEKVKPEIELLLSQQNIVLLYGNSGTGKTSLVKSIAKDADYGKIVLTEYSNSSYRNSNLTDFKLALGNAGIKNASANDENLASAVASDLPMAKNSLRHVICLFKNNTLNKLEREYFNIFNEDEKSIIIRLSKESRQKSLLLIFDNLHWANINDINFIHNFSVICCNEKLFNYPIKIILVVTSNQHENPDFRLKDLIDIFPGVNLDSVAVERYAEILDLMGMEDHLSEQASGAIYSLTSGHLELTKKVVDYINTQGSSVFNMLDDIEKQAMTMMAGIFDQMIQFYFKNKQDTIGILEIASVIGNIFNRYELKALTQEELFLIEKQLSSAAGEHFIEVEDDKAQFIHPIIRELFYKKLDDKRYSYHKKYAQELKRLKPTEHLEIAYHLEQCREEESALWETFTAYCLSVLSQTHFPESNYKDMKKRAIKQRLDKYVDYMEQAVKCYSIGEVQKSIEFLDNIDAIDMNTDLYCSVKDYLYGRNLLLYKFDTDSFKRSAELLETAKKCFYLHWEFELYMSSLTILLNIYAYKLCDIAAAVQIEKQIIDLYHNELRDCIDTKMNDYLFEYKRKSASICTPETAWHRTNEAFEHFKNSENMIELYKSACDHSAACIFLGKFEEALKALEVCGRTVENYRIIAFPETFKPLNNYFIASLYLDLHSFLEQIDTAIDAYAQIKSRNQYITKIIDINMAGLMILAGRLDEAEIILDSLKGKLAEYKSVFYYTFIYTNLASLNLLRQKYEQAMECLCTVKDHLDEWGNEVRGFYKKQASILQQMIEDREELTPAQLFMRPATAIPEFSGTTWKFIGRGILFSELLFYTT